LVALWFVFIIFEFPHCLCVIVECGGNVTNASTVATPGYPQAINQSLICLWIIDAPMMADNAGSVNILNYTLNFVGDANDTECV